MADSEQPATPTKLNVSQAARAVGRARSTLNRDIANGKVSVVRSGTGQPFIEIAELERAYGRVDIETLTETVSNGQDATDEISSPDRVLSREIELLRERLATIDLDRDRERQDAADQIADLRRRLDQAEQERRDKDRQLTALLTDQRKPEPPTPVPVAKPAVWRRALARLIGG